MMPMLVRSCLLHYRHRYGNHRDVSRSPPKGRVHPYARPVLRYPAMASLSPYPVEMFANSRYLLEFLILSVGFYSFQQWVFYRTLAKRMKEEEEKDKKK